MWKFNLDVTDTQIVRLPEGALMRCVAMQGAQLCLWAEVVPTRETEKRTICIYGTGQEITAFDRTYLGTFQMRGGALVFHAYEAHI